MPHAKAGFTVVKKRVLSRWGLLKIKCANPNCEVMLKPGDRVFRTSNGNYLCPDCAYPSTEKRKPVSRLRLDNIYNHF